MKQTITLAAAMAMCVAAGASEMDNAGMGVDQAATQAFTDFTDFATFQSAVGGPITRLGFAELSDGTPITNQYSGQGIVFTDGDDTAVEDPLFVEDGVGVRGSGRIHLQLSQPAVAVGVFFPGAATIEAFESQGGPSVHTSTDFGGSGSGHFGGILGDTPFSFVEIRDWVDDSVFIDDLVIAFAPPEGAITGCLDVTGIPLVLNPVLLLQPGEQPQLALTDENGCYQFDEPVPAKWFSIYVLGTIVPF